MADDFYEQMQRGDREEFNFYDKQLADYLGESVRTPLPVSEAQSRLQPTKWGKLDQIERLTVIYDAQKAALDFFNDHVSLPRTADDIEDDIDITLPKYPSPTLRTIAPVYAGGNSNVQASLTAEPLRLGASPAAMSWLGFAVSQWLRVLHDRQDFVVRNRPPLVTLADRGGVYTATVMQIKPQEQLVDPLVRGEVMLGDMGDFFKLEDCHPRVERVVHRSKDYRTPASAAERESIPFLSAASLEDIAKERKLHYGRDLDVRLSVMAAVASVGSQLFIFGNVVDFHTDCPHAAAAIRHLFGHIIRHYPIALEVHTYGAAARLDVVAAEEGSPHSSFDALLQRDRWAVTTDEMPAELGVSYVSPAAMQNTWVLLAKNEGMTQWTNAVFVNRLADYVAENRPRIIMYDADWKGVDAFKERVRRTLGDTAKAIVDDGSMAWQPFSNLEHEWSTAVMTPCVSVFASLEQHLGGKLSRQLRDRSRMEIIGVKERQERALQAVKQRTNAKSARSRTLKGRALLGEAAKKEQSEEFLRPMRVVGVNTNAMDALLAHPQLEFSPGRVGNSMRFESVQRSVVHRPFGTGAWFNGQGGGLQTNSESGKASRTVLRQERGAKVLHRTLVPSVVQFTTARMFGV